MKYAVCPRCEGKGVHVNPSIDPVSREQFDEDPQFEEDYFEGVYDVACYRCKGQRVVEAGENGTPRSEHRCLECGKDANAVSYQEYPGAHLWTDIVCSDENCQGDVISSDE